MQKTRLHFCQNVFISIFNLLRKRCPNSRVASLIYYRLERNPRQQKLYYKFETIALCKHAMRGIINLQESDAHICEKDVLLFKLQNQTKLEILNLWCRESYFLTRRVTENKIVTTHLLSIERADWSKLHVMFKAHDAKHGNAYFRLNFRLEFVPRICCSSTLFTMLLFV